MYHYIIYRMSLAIYFEGYCHFMCKRNTFKENIYACAVLHWRYHIILQSYGHMVNISMLSKS